MTEQETTAEPKAASEARRRAQAAQVATMLRDVSGRMEAAASDLREIHADGETAFRFEIGLVPAAARDVEGVARGLAVVAARFERMAERMGKEASDGE